MTEPYIKHIAHIDSTTGNINRISLAPPMNVLAEGTFGTETRKHLMSDFVIPGGYTTNADFMKYYYWDFIASDWAPRSAPPNKVCNWTASGWAWTEEHFWRIVREERDAYLLASDWTVLPDSPLSETEKNQAMLYRAGLRDITLQQIPQSGVVADLTWPGKPAFL